MSDGLVVSLLKKVTGLFIDVNKLKDDTNVLTAKYEN
jgi:hypothetical protein